jgi:hypothetical protein
MTYIHEYSHGIFGEILNPLRKEIKIPGKFYSTIYATLTEGFAVNIELLCCDLLRSNPEKYGLDARDVEDVSKFKEQRLASLFENSIEPFKIRQKLVGTDSMAYAEGFKLINQLCESGGICGLESFLNRMDFEKSIRLSTDSEEYGRAYSEALNNNFSPLQALVGK